MHVTFLRNLLRHYGGLAVPVVGVCLLFHALRRRKRVAFPVAALGAIAALLVMGALSGGRQNRSELRVTFLDVGKGDAAVIETPSGKVVVLDTGGSSGREGDMGEKVIAPFLKRRGIRRIDMLLLSHPHNDHIGGTISLLRQFPVGVLLENGAGTGDKQMQKVRNEAKSRNVPIRCIRRDDTLDFGANVSARILSPESGTKFRLVNDNSLVLRVQYRKRNFLFTADAQADAEKEMLRTRQPLVCDVLKVGHHGHKSSSIPDFLAAAKPRYAVISVDANNKYGCPHPETLERFAKIGAQVFRTDQNGTITCDTDGEKLTVRQDR